MQLLKSIKFICLIYLLLFQHSAYAGWWTNFLNFFVDPITSPTYYFGNDADSKYTNAPRANPNEGKYYTPSYNPLDIPYDRKVGRGPLGTEKNCIYQYDLNNYKISYQKVCAEDPGINSAHVHKIKLRNVVCTVGCWYQDFMLDGVKGQCKMFGTKELVVAKRICARIAAPPGDGYAADPGYTQGVYVDTSGNPILKDGNQQMRGKHLDEYGVNRWDELFVDRDGTSYPILKPKICAYEDPWAGDLWTFYMGFDIFDLNPLAQPFHGNSGIKSPVANIIIKLLTFYKAYQLLLPGIAELIVTAIVGVSGGDTDVLGTIFQVVNYMMTLGVSATIDVLNLANDVNRLVLSSYGCVEIPLGPYPPNYCSSVSSTAKAKVIPICSTDASGKLQQNCYGTTSTQTNKTDGSAAYTLCSTQKCVHSTKDNNFLYNSLRVAYSHPVQLCSSIVTKNCVNISPALSRASAMTTNNNMVSGSSLNLVNVSGVDLNTSKNYRVLYQVLSSGGTSTEVSNYSYVDLPDCAASTNGYVSPSGPVAISTQFCQKIWGVDLGDYSDNFNISVSSTNTAPISSLSTSDNAIPLIYKDIFTGQASSGYYYASIDQQHQSEYMNMCVYQTFPSTSIDDIKIDCIARRTVPSVNVSSCTSNTATHTSPCIKLSWSAIGRYATYSQNIELVNTAFPSDWSYSPSQAAAYLGGAQYTTKVVDATNQMQPFEAATANAVINTITGDTMTDSLFGTYLNNIKPSDSCLQDSCAIYLNGLEFGRGSYIRGGTNFCVDEPSGCKDDVTQCVLSKISSITGAASTRPANRVSPSNTTSPTLLSTEYYSYDGQSTIPFTQDVRNKVGLENSGLCVLIPSATCSASTDSGTYNATWPDNSTTGALITGSCASGYVPVNSNYMQRYCLLKSTGQTAWDTSTNFSSTFKGCTAGCISDVTVTSTNNGANNGSITGTNTANSDGTPGGTILFKSGDMTDENTRSGSYGISSSTNTFTVNFTIPTGSDLSKIDVYFSSLSFKDYARVSVNGTQITNDSDLIGGAVLWSTATSPSSSTMTTNNYKSTDPNLSRLNALVLSNLRVGSNTITVTVKTVSSGFAYVKLVYNQSCYSQCSAVTTADGSTGNATWTKAPVGALSTGTCAEGYTAVDSTKMSRACSIVNSSSTLDTISNGVSNNTTLGAQFAGCTGASCSNDGAGNATWQSVLYNGSSTTYSTGICNAGYVPNDSTKMRRACNLVNSVAQLEAVTNGTSTNFGGCTNSCISNITLPSPTQISTQTVSNTTTNSQNSDGSGTIVMQTSTGQSCCGVWGNNASNSWYFNFNVKDVAAANVYFSNLFFDDSARVKVNGVAITSDTAQLNGYNLWYTGNNGETALTRNYNTLDSGFANLNAAIKSNLVVGSNTIQVDHNTGGGGFLYATLQYNTNCLSSAQCFNDDAGNATWSTASAGGSSTGTCKTNYVMNNSSKMSRTCVSSGNGLYQLEKVVNGSSVNGNFAGCTLGTCSNDGAGYATWSTASAGSLSTGTCNSGYSAAGSMTRYCQTNSAKTSTYLDPVSANSGYNSGTSSGTGASFQGCIADRINQVSAWNSNHGWNGCTTDIKTWWSGTTYYLSFNTCWGWGNNGIYTGGTVENAYYIKFYVPTEAAKSSLSIIQLDFDDFVRVTVHRTDSAGNVYSSSQATEDNQGVFRGSTPYVVWGTSENGWNTGEVGGWRHYYDGQSFSTLSTAIRSRLQVGWNIIETRLKTTKGGGIYVTYQFNNPY